jgi:pimeloyl-ACP methyl ester carboxylesterase
VVFVVAALLLAGCNAKKSDPAAAPSGSASGPASIVAGGDGRSDPGAYASALHWTDLSKQINKALSSGGAKPARKLTFARATMKVPLNWADMAPGKQVSLTVLRVRAVSQHDRIGSLVINPGGPGDAATEAALELAAGELPAAILDRFDIVGFDPRGVGLSDPIKCIPTKQKNAELSLPADPTSDAAWSAQLADSTKVADECAKIYGSDLTYYSTAETVRDMEALRAKLGDQKLTYLGYSYGTLLGAQYAAAYPDKVRALVLDGAVDPTIDTVDDDKTQAAGFQLAFSHYAASCTKLGTRCKLGADPLGFVQQLMAKTDAKPIRSGDASDKRTANDGAVFLAVISALYDQTQWPTLTSALVDASKGDAAGILALDDDYTQRQPNGSYTNFEDAIDTISCADTVDRPSIAEGRTLQPEWDAANPLFGGSAAANVGFCSLWKAPADTPIEIVNNHAPTVLVVGTTGDPATPISGARHLAALLGSGDLLVWEGDGHTAYPKTRCVTAAVDAYLIDLTAPAAGTTCPAT